MPLGNAPTASTEVFTAPFPQSQTVNTSVTFLTDLTNTLTNNLSVQTSGSLGTILDPLVNTVILPALTPIVTNAVNPVVTPVLAGVVDPALQQLGTGIGELDLTVNAINEVAPPEANADIATTAENQAVAVPPSTTTRRSPATRSQSPPSPSRPTVRPSSTPTAP